MKIKCILNCPICDSQVEKTKSYIEKSKNGLFYCSRKCMGIGHKKAELYPCTTCGTLSEQFLRVVKSNKNLFCSRKCYDVFQNKSIKLTCICGKDFLKQKSQYILRKNHYCSKKCQSLENNKIIRNCAECSNELQLHSYQIKKSKSGNFFCCRSCIGKFYTRNKTFGVNRSKFEMWLENNLQIDFPNLIFDFNNKTELGYELDIFIPSIKIAIEIHGPTHYQAIYGEDRLKRTKELDLLKIELCKEKNINHYIIDVSNIRSWRPNKTITHYEDIKEIIKNNFFNNF